MAQLQRPGSKGDWDILSYTIRVICAELCQLRDPDTWGKRECLSSKKSDLCWRFFKLEPRSQLYRIRWGTGRDQISLLTVREFWMSSLANAVSTSNFIEELLGNPGWLSRGSISMQEVPLSGSVVNVQKDLQRLGSESVDEENIVLMLRRTVEIVVDRWTSKGKRGPLRQAHAAHFCWHNVAF